jgi:cytochrome c6
MNCVLKYKLQTIFLIASVFSVFTQHASAQSEAEKTYKAKCAACHGADGSGNTPAGKTLKVVAFSDPDVQKQSDADFTAIVAKGKNKMPAYEKSLKPDEIKRLVDYVRELGKK